jgi:hypothetical protein
VFFSRVTLFSFHLNQSDAVQSGSAFASANMCFLRDLMVTAGYNAFSVTDRFRTVAVMVADAYMTAADGRTACGGHCIVK